MDTVHGIRHADIILPEGTACGMEIPVPGSELCMVMIRARQGYLICGIADIEVCRKIRDVAAIVYATGLAAMLEGEVALCTAEAAQRGIAVGMKGVDALKRLL